MIGLLAHGLQVLRSQPFSRDIGAELISFSPKHVERIEVELHPLDRTVDFTRSILFLEVGRRAVGEVEDRLH